MGDSFVQSIAQGDLIALHGLYERAHSPVFTLIMRITGNREIAEELTIDVFHGVWLGASHYDAASGTVLSWIMNEARSRAIDASPLKNRESDSQDLILKPGEVPADPIDELDAREASQSLPAALATLDLLRPATSLRGRLALRMVEETGRPLMVPSESGWSEPDCRRRGTASARRRTLDRRPEAYPGRLQLLHVRHGRRPCLE
jgi:RNA polymerase sigma-70 factor (ECF subfamily)